MFLRWRDGWHKQWSYPSSKRHSPPSSSSPCPSSSCVTSTGSSCLSLPRILPPLLYPLSAVLDKHWISRSPPGGCSWLSPHVVCWTSVPADALTVLIVGASLIKKRWSFRRTTTTKTETASAVQRGWVCVSAGQPLWMVGFQMARLVGQDIHSSHLQVHHMRSYVTCTYLYMCFSFFFFCI